MGYLEIKLYDKLKLELGNGVASHFWTHYRRFLDDGQIMWDSRLCDFKEVFNRMNLLHPSISFTCDNDSSKLVYLNVTILKTKFGFKTEIFNKDTDSDTYLPFNSSHPRSCREAIPFELARSVVKLTDNSETASIKLTELQARLVRCDYPAGLVETAMQSARSLNKYDLRVVNTKKDDDEVTPFVHTFDPGLPQIFSTIQGITSRLYTSSELKPIFGGSRIINSLREPPSLGLQLQHSRFDGPSVTDNEPGVKRCGQRGCGHCVDILEVNSIYFPNSDIHFHIKTRMNCLVRNVVYFIQCKKCSHTYIGETVNFRRRMNKHKSDSQSIMAASIEVSKHLCMCGEGFWKCPIFKVKEESKIARLVIEDKLVKLLKPDLNKDKRNLLHLTSLSHFND